jgi:hypothetical protein
MNKHPLGGSDYYRKITKINPHELTPHELTKKTVPSTDFRPPQKFDLDVMKTFEELEQLLLRKHTDYGPKNIALAPGGPINGLRVRMWDKMARINNLVDSNQESLNEPLEDSFADLANYAIIGLMVLRGQWPNE